MFTEILQVKPKLSDGDLGSMERSLNSRFARVAKRFGGGILSALKGGGIAAIGLTLIDKLLNPLQQIQETIDKTLNRGNEIATFAKHFGTTPAALVRLQQFAQAKGLDPGELNVLIEKFQEAVVQQKKNPDQRTAVVNYQNRTDMVEAFFEFIQARQKLRPDQQSAVDQETFGGRQILKSAEFLGADFQALNKNILSPGSARVNAAVKNTDDIAAAQAAAQAQSGVYDFVNKSDHINLGQVALLHARDQAEQARETKRLDRFSDLEKTAIAMDKLTNLLQDAFLKLTPYLSKLAPFIINNLAGGVAEIGKSRVMRGVGVKKDD